MQTPFFVPSILKTISKELYKRDAQAIIVGGSVRDYYLNLSIKDYDVEVYGLSTMEELEQILSSFGSVNLVGKSFGVLKFKYEGDEYDFSFPRTESKTGLGHKDFDVIVDGSLNYHVAFKRRDFTINAMAYHVEKEQFIDPFNGLDDLKNKTLKHIDDKTFVEDPLRVYRAVQFCARFDFSLADKTFDLCKKMVANKELDSLAKERVYEEFKKLLLKSPQPSLGFELMRKLGILNYFPELQAIIGIRQSPKWHPEGDVWVHTMMSLDVMVSLLGEDKKDNLVLMFATLCHDLGKATTTTIDEDGNIRAIGHESASLSLSESFLNRLTNESELVERILPLVEHHLKPSQFFSAKSKDKAIRRLATKVNIKELITLAKADFLGRTTDEAKLGVYHAGEWLHDKSQKLNVEIKPLENLLQGKDLIKLGFKPSPLFKKILDDVYDLQLSGSIRTHKDAISYVKISNYKNSP